jgi:hypothetical protein
VEEGYTPIGGEESSDVVCKTKDIDWEILSSRLMALGTTQRGVLNIKASDTFTDVSVDEFILAAPTEAVIELEIATDEIDLFSHFQFTLEVRPLTLKEGVTGDYDEWIQLGSVSEPGSNWYNRVEINLNDALMSYESVGADPDCDLVSTEQTNIGTNGGYHAVLEVSKALEFRVRPFVKAGLGDLSGTYRYELSASRLK